MFFILSKVLYFLLIPFWWIVILFVWMKFSRNPRIKKRLFIVIIAIGLLFTNPFLYQLLVRSWQPEPVMLSTGKTFEAGIVLGGMAGHDKYKRGYFGNNADRFIQAANLYHRGIIKKIIITGGTSSLNQSEPPESFFLREAFMDNGIRDTDIIIESRSRNTFENAVYSKQIIDSMQLRPPFVLITSALHMPRSTSVFTKAGYDFVMFPCDYKVTPQKTDIEDFIPNIALLSEWSYFIKEIVGLYVYKLTGKA